VQAPLLFGATDDGLTAFDFGSGAGVIHHALKRSHQLVVVVDAFDDVGEVLLGLRVERDWFHAKCFDPAKPVTPFDFFRMSRNTDFTHGIGSSTPGASQSKADSRLLDMWFTTE
jgi:hypothetical protein